MKTSKKLREVPHHWSLARRLAHHSKRAANGCRLWTAFQRSSGYGQLWWEGRWRPAHRLAWRVAHGPIPQGLQVCHRCDLRACINVRHLYLGTKRERHADTIERDRHAKGPALAARVPYGERHPFAKLTKQAVRAIIKAKGTHRAIAARYGVDHSVIGRIKRRVLWKSVSLRRR